MVDIFQTALLLVATAIAVRTYFAQRAERKDSAEERRIDQVGVAVIDVLSNQIKRGENVPGAQAEFFAAQKRLEVAIRLARGHFPACEKLLTPSGPDVLREEFYKPALEELTTKLERLSE